MEFAYLSDITGEPLFKNLVERVRTVIQESSKPNTLYPNYLNPKTGKWGQQVHSIIFNLNLLHYSLYTSVNFEVEVPVGTSRLQMSSKMFIRWD